MQKVYLLLRDNRQTGPYSLDELLQLGLKPFDLIWVEGKSFGWSYPAEIEQLKPYAPKQPETVIDSPVNSRDHYTTFESARVEEKIPIAASKPDTKKIFISLPGNTLRQAATVAEQAPTASDALEQKAEELRKRAQAYAASKPQAPAPALETKLSRTLSDVEEDFTSWVYTKKISTQKHSLKKYAKPLAAFVFLFASGFFVFKMITKPESPGIAKQQEPAIQKSVEAPAITETPAEKQDVSMEPALDEQITTAIRTEEAPQQAKPKKAEKPASNIAKTAKASIPTVAGVPQKNESPAPVMDKEEAPVSTEKAEVVVTDQGEQKKTLGQKIDGFFGKLKTKREERKKAGASADNGEERSATRRGDAPELVDITELADLSSNERSNEWMMGVQGLKLNLKNNSNLTIKTAEVEVRYYNDQNDLLDKKIVRFANIPSKKSVTMPAPDHRLADHVAYKVLSAKGVTDSYARQ